MQIWENTSAGDLQLHSDSVVQQKEVCECLLNQTCHYTHNTLHWQVFRAVRRVSINMPQQ